MPSASDFIDADLANAVRELLDLHPDGISEHELIRALRCSGIFSFLPQPPAPPETLFRAHFLLFHALYRLRDQTLERGERELEINPLRIRWLPYRSGSGGVTNPDRMRAYYLDLANLETTGKQEVEEMIASFWVRLQQQDGRAEALAELGLSDPVENETIKQRYRRLAMQHHPDRGGDGIRLRAINRAVDLLLKPE